VFTARAPPPPEISPAAFARNPLRRKKAYGVYYVIVVLQTSNFAGNIHAAITFWIFIVRRRNWLWNFLRLCTSVGISVKKGLRNAVGVTSL
jgi:hypothetical protein